MLVTVLQMSVFWRQLQRIIMDSGVLITKSDADFFFSFTSQFFPGIIIGRENRICVRIIWRPSAERTENGGENDETKRKRRALREEKQESREAKTRAPREETITDDLRTQVISCCAFAQLLEHLVCP